VTCPHCHESAKFVEYRDRGLHTLLGSGRHERVYYHCSHCHQGWFPTDEELGIEHKQTPGCREVVSLTGVLEPFEEAADTLLPMHERKRTGSHETSARLTITSDILALEKLVASEIASSVASDTSVTSSSRASHRVWPTRYVCGVMSLAEIGKQLRAECVAVGIAQADVVLGLTDGGNGLEACLVETVLTGLAHETVLILDFFHATEHLREFAKAWLPDESTRKDQVDRWCHTLKHQGGCALLIELETLDQTCRTEGQLEAHRLLTQYIRNNQHRMDYPTYIANGWEILHRQRLGNRFGRNRIRRQKRDQSSPGRPRHALATPRHNLRSANSVPSTAASSLSGNATGVVQPQLDDRQIRMGRLQILLQGDAVKLQLGRVELDRVAIGA